MTHNRLADAASPYLRQHKDNPVHWWPWGEEALAAARAEDRPILLSVGYAACHWCHVMAHESFEDDEVAAVMNAHFINIKIDREERPDLDAIYMHALHMLGEQGGWPLTMFLTPEGEPFWGGTYFPKQPAYGRPGFVSVLTEIARLWREERGKVLANRDGMREGLKKLGEGAAPTPLDPRLDTLAGERLLGAMDQLHGGLGTAPKFPHVPVLEILWRAHLRTGRQDYREAVERAAIAMAQGGIYDHLGGGFARYAVDAEWLVPHFEKMLYDNAQLVRLMTVLWGATENPLYAARVAETAGWLLREMVTEDGGFASALDADSEGEEGKFYVWREAEVDTALGEFSEDERLLFKRIYDVTPGGNWEGVSILNRLEARDWLGEAEEERLAAMRAALLTARAGRVRPMRDDKVLADWNGLMIAALADAGTVFARADWVMGARHAFDFIAEALGDGDRLHHSALDGAPANKGMAEDYANMADAAIALHRATGEAGFLDRAAGWLATLEKHFTDPATGGLYMSPDDAGDLIARPRAMTDAATPAAAATALRAHLHLHHLTGAAAHRDRAEALIRALAPEIAQNIVGGASALNAAALIDRPLQVVVAGPRDDVRTLALLRAALSAGVPDVIAQVIEDGAALPAGHPAHGKAMVEGAPAAYLCIGPACQPPVRAPDDLRAALREAAAG
jgi:uncharacterized protein YyaL (SSP411 family)